MKNEKGFLEKVKKNLKSVFGPGHSKAGRKYMVGQAKKKKEIEKTRLSKVSKKQLGYLSDDGYQEVMKVLKRK